MYVHKLHIAEFDKIDYQLIAIHSPLEDYRLAYFINKYLPINLKKCHNNIQISNKEGETQFTRFIFEDHQDVAWSLIQNQNDAIVSVPSNNLGLFAESSTEFAPKIYLIPEFKKVDYFFKIENDEVPIDVLNIINCLKKIDKISTVYTVDVANIKSKNNLIF
jgi:hypothetical protein